MNEYEKTANEFLKSCGASLKIDRVGVVDRFPGDNDKKLFGLRYKYRIRILRKNYGSFSLDFYGSVADYNAGREASSYGVLACLQKYDVGNFEDFCSEYGYNGKKLSEFPRVMKIYKAVKREYKNVSRVFGDVLDALQEIN